MAYPQPTAGQFNSPAFQAFLARYPVFAQAARDGSISRFLDNHPAIATAYRNLLTPPAATPAAPAASSTPTPVTSVAPAGPTDVQTTAKGYLNTTLAAYGLSGLGDWAWQQYLNGTPTSQIMLDLRQRPEYKARFPGMDALSQQGRAIDEGSYITLERQYVARARAYGLPANFYDDPSDFGTLIANNVSPEEYESRLQLAARYSNDSPQAVELRDEYSRLYGPIAGQGAAVAYMIDPSKALDVLQRQHEAAQAASVAAQTGFGTLSRQQAEQVAGYGVSQQQEQQTFSQLAGLNELRRDLPGMAPDAVSDDTALQAGFGQNADAQRRIERAGKGRVAALQGGGGPRATQRGVTGLGTATT